MGDDQKSRWGKKGVRHRFIHQTVRTFERQTSSEFSLGVRRLCRESPMGLSHYPLVSPRSSLRGTESRGKKIANNEHC